MLVVYGAVRVIEDPGQHLDGFAEGADIAYRLQAELQRGDDSLRLNALNYVRKLLIEWMNGRTSSGTAGLPAGRDHSKHDVGVWFAQGAEEAQIAGGAAEFCEGKEKLRYCMPRNAKSLSLDTAEERTLVTRYRCAYIYCQNGDPHSHPTL